MDQRNKCSLSFHRCMQYLLRTSHLKRVLSVDAYIHMCVCCVERTCHIHGHNPNDATFGNKYCIKQPKFCLRVRAQSKQTAKVKARQMLLDPKNIPRPQRPPTKSIHAKEESRKRHVHRPWPSRKSVEFSSPTIVSPATELCVLQ